MSSPSLAIFFCRGNQAFIIQFLFESNIVDYTWNDDQNKYLGQDSTCTLTQTSGIFMNELSGRENLRKPTCIECMKEPNKIAGATKIIQ